MFNTTAEFKEEIKKPSRSFECRITIGDLIFTNEDIVDIKFDGNIQPSEGFIIGATTSTTLDLTLLNSEDHIYSTNQIKVEIGLKIGSKIEYILMGYYNIDDIEKTDYTTKFTAYDNMIKFETPYFSKLGNTATLQQIVNELATITGVEFTGSLPAYNLKKLEGFTCREILSFVASICGGNALITREGKFTIVYPKDINYELTTDNYFEYKKEEVPYKVGKVSCQVGEEILSKGSLGTDSMELEFENPWINETILNDIYNKLKGFSYLGYTMKWQGDISLDVGDIITVTDTKGVVRKLPILSQSFTYTGGLTSEISAQGESKNKNSFSSNGNMNNKVNRVVTELLIVNEALINKANIQDLQATNAEIQNLKASNAEIENALIKFATIEQLNATNANIQNLIAEDARINQAIINKADITELNALDGKITNLQSEVGKIGVLESNVANIKDIINGNLSSENIQAGGITGDRLNMDTIFVKDANMINVNISALKAGDISTNKFRIVSDDGGIEIVGATQQFKDKNNKVRIQMGKDTQGNFNFILRGEDGTTTLIDHNGIKEKAIADNLIKENMVAPDTIGEKSINYNSFATGFNKDTNTSTIKGTKVRLDNQNQTLDIAFNSLKTQADGTKSLTESHSTTIGVMQGEIKTAINNTTITKDGQTILLKDDYNRTVATVNSMSSTIGSHTTQINEHTGKITGVESKTNVLERDLNSMSSKLTSTEQTVSKHTNQINSVQSIANNANDKADSANDKYDNLQISGRNLIPCSFLVAHGCDKVDYSEKYKNIPTYLFTVNNPGVGNNFGITIKKVLKCLGKGVTFALSFFYNVIEFSNPSGLQGYVKCRYSDNTSEVFSFSKLLVNSNDSSNFNKWHKLEYVFTTNKNKELVEITNFYVYCDAAKANTRAFITAPMLQIGNKVTDWNLANEDTQEQIDKNKNDIVTVNTEITTTKNKVSTIEQNMDSITQRVGSVETITTSHTASLNAVDGKINTAKTQVLNDSKAFTNAEITKVNTTMNSKFAEIKTTTDAINLEVNNTKKEVEKVNVKVDNVQIGGRNLALKTSLDFTAIYNSFNGGENMCPSLARVQTKGLKIGDKITVRLIYKYENVIPADGKQARCWIQGSGNVTSWSSGQFPPSTRKDISGNGEIEFLYTFEMHSEHLKNSYWDTSIRHDYVKSGSVRWKAFKVEKGTKDTDWTAAPEDTSKEIIDVTTTKINDAKAEIKLTTDSIKQSVSNVESKTTTINNNLSNTNSEVNTLKSKTTTLETNLSGITGRVTNVESSTASLNGEMTSIKSRVQTAEQKLTATSIINSVSEALNSGKSITSTSTVLTKDYFKVKSGSYDSYTLAPNNFTMHNSGNGSETLKIINENCFYDGTNSYTYGPVIKPAGGSAHININDDIKTNEGNNFLRMNKAGWIAVNRGITFNRYIVTEGINRDSSRTTRFGVGNGQGGVFSHYTNEINMLAPERSRLWINYRDWATETKLGNGNGQGGLGKFICGSLEVTGTKKNIVSTRNFGFIGMQSYETTDCWYGDIGSGITDDKGVCYIHINPVFKETVNTDIDYKVFISIKDEDLQEDDFVMYKVNTSNPNFFRVKTNIPNVRFDYEIKARRKGYENVRLERSTYEEEMPKILAPMISDVEADIKENEEELKRNLALMTLDEAGIENNTNMLKINEFIKKEREIQ